MNVLLIHGLFLGVAWLALIPFSLFITRYFKVTPGQDYPNRLDNTFWWKTHLFCNTMALIFSIIGILILLIEIGAIFTSHAVIGYIALSLAILTAISGLLRGTSGGPDKVHPKKKKWDHYHMTRHRIIFEWFHKICGRLAFCAALVAIGLQSAFIQVYWVYFLPLAVLFITLWIGSVILEHRPRVTTYQAIWGPDQRHPGNRCSSHSSSKKL